MADKFKLCCVCGTRHGAVYNFRHTLQIVGFKRTTSNWNAVPSCVTQMKLKHENKRRRRGERIDRHLEVDQW